MRSFSTDYAFIYACLERLPILREFDVIFTRRFHANQEYRWLRILRLVMKFHSSDLSWGDSKKSMLKYKFAIEVKKFYRKWSKNRDRNSKIRQSRA